MTFSRQFFGVLDDTATLMGGTTAKFQNANDLPEFTPRWFILLWQMIRASVPVMEFAVEALERRCRRSEFEEELLEYFHHHIEEEQDHDEWLIADLNVLGWDRSSIASQSVPVAITQMVGAQYYHVRFTHPALLLGYIGLLEGYPATLDQYERLVEMSRKPEKAWRTFKSHALLDPEHREDVIRMLNKVPEDHALRAQIISNAINAGERYISALEAITGEFYATKGREVA